MQNISIDFVSQNDIRISIDGKKITDVTGFSLEIKVGETEKYCIEKNISKMPKQVENRKTNQTEQWRKIPDALKELKEEDPKTAITECSIRDLVKTDKISSFKDGRVIKINLLELKEYYRSGGKMARAIKPARPKVEPIF